MYIGKTRSRYDLNCVYDGVTSTNDKQTKQETGINDENHRKQF